MSLDQLNYLELFHNAPEMIISTDPYTRKIVDCNQTLLKLTGFKKIEIIGKSIFL